MEYPASVFKAEEICSRFLRNADVSLPSSMLSSLRRAFKALLKNCEKRLLASSFRLSVRMGQLVLNWKGFNTMLYLSFCEKCVEMC